MFRRISSLSIVVFALVATLWVFNTCIVKESDMLTYRRFKESQDTPSTPQTLSATTHQTRQGVSKDIWFAQEDGSRLQTRIKSVSSTLTLHPQGHHFEIVEDLHHIHSWMQDKLFHAPDGSPMQQMRYLEAETGTYLYTTQQFLAQTVGISLYRLPGQTLVFGQEKNAPFIKGLAQDVSFSVSGKEPQFQARNFKAQFTKSIAGAP